MLTRTEVNASYREQVIEAQKAGEVPGLYRRLAQRDLFFLITVIFGREDVDRDWLYERCTEVQQNPDGHLDLWFREGYKAVDIYEPVPTPGGWKCHGSLKPGDRVFGIDGTPCNVVAVTPVTHNASCCRVSFTDGYQVVVSRQHLWRILIKHHNRQGSGKGRKIVFSTQFVNTGNLEMGDNVGVSAPLQYPDALLPVDPYVLGVWLGDGGRGDARITASLSDADEMESLLLARGVDVHRAKHSSSVSLCVGNGKRGKRGSSDFRNGLREIGVFGNKHIPERYLFASVGQRFDLLRGLMDTDGSCDKRGKATFCNKSDVLASDFYKLAMSLGLRPRIKSYFQTVNDLPYKYWQINFQAYRVDRPFRMRRKLDRCKTGKRYETAARYVASVKDTEQTPVSCIQVDSPDGCYLIGEKLVPTHNSSIITYGLTIQDILNNPEVTIGIFSYNRPTAKAFLRQIKREFEANDLLKGLFPEILWANPSGESPKWSEDEGIVVRRKTNPKESTVEAWGLVDGQPTGRHFQRMIYDDVVTLESVSTPEMCQKTIRAWEMSRNLTAEGGKTRYIGTRYSYNDAYGEMMRREVVKPRIYPVYDKDKNPVLLSVERIEEKRKELGVYVFASQMLQNPVADEAQNFKEEWLQTWPAQTTDNLRIYILVDPASKKKKNSDYTAMFVVGLGLDKNYYIIDMIRDRLNLTERTQTLFGLHEKYHPLATGYEEYGMQSDIEHLMYVMEKENYRFPIYPLGGNVGKEDRIRALVPIFEQKRVYLPQVCIRPRRDGKVVDLTKVFIEEEYKTFPVGAHDDMLDALARILDHGKKGIFATFPEGDMPVVLRRPPTINEVARLEREEIWQGVRDQEEQFRALFE